MGQGAGSQTGTGQGDARREAVLERVWALPAQHAARRDLLRARGEDPRAWLQGSGQGLADPEVACGLIDGFQHGPTGLSVKVHREHPVSWGRPQGSPNPRYEQGRLCLHGSLYHGERFVSALRMGVERDPDGALEARIGSLSLRPERGPENGHSLAPGDDEQSDRWLGQGFGRSLHEHLVRGLRAQGAERLVLSATDAGRYAWAALGYEHDPRSWRGEARSAREAQGRLVRASLLHGTGTLVDESALGALSSAHVGREGAVGREPVATSRAAFRALLRHDGATVLDVARVGRDEPWVGSDGHSAWDGMLAVGDWQGLLVL